MKGRTLARTLGTLLLAGGLYGALDSNARWKVLDKRADIVEFRTLESELLAENLLVVDDGKYRLNPPDTTVTLSRYIEGMFKIYGYEDRLEHMPLMIGIMESAMYKERQNIYVGMSGIGALLIGASFLRKKK